MKLAVFDIDGTLTDSLGFDAHYYAALSRRLGVPNPDRPLECWTHVTDEAIVQEFFEMHGQCATAEDIEWTKVNYRAALETHLHDVPQVPGASQFLVHLRRRSDWHVIFGTGNWGFAGEMKLDAGGIDRSGMTVVGCDGRPERTTVMEHALRVGLEESGPAERVVYVGDRHYDAHAARELGWSFVGRASDPDTLRALGATHVLSDYLDVEAALSALENARVPLR